MDTYLKMKVTDYEGEYHDCEGGSIEVEREMFPVLQSAPGRKNKRGILEWEGCDSDKFDESWDKISNDSLVILIFLDVGEGPSNTENKGIENWKYDQTESKKCTSIDVGKLFQVLNEG